jgi:OmpA-OmpF porin, OOP family
MKLRFALLAATVLALPVAAKAQPVTGPYVSLGAGDNILLPEKIKNNGAKALFSNGYAVDGSVGYGFGNGFRVELEGNYAHNGLKKMDLGSDQAIATGSESKYGVFANALYDFDVGLPWLFPYVGAGVGWQLVDWHDVASANLPNSPINKSKGAFAYQGIVGVAIPIQPVPGLSATVEYRYIGINSRKYSGVKVDNESNNQVMVGLRYALFQPAPPAPAPTPAPVAAPAPAPARTYLVFFDWDKYNLTPRATQIIAQAAADSQHQNTTTINVSGYTDTSGTPAYNDKLSMRRAVAVENQLVADGVSKSEIAVQAYGETHLLVPTGPGVREPQNRRVEIVLN